MPGMSIQAGNVGIDFSGAAIAAATARKDGAAFIMRYSAGVGTSNSNSQWKLCKPGEIHDAVAAGIDFLANSEWYESRVTEGAAAGHADGEADLAFWKSRGLARGASIYCSWDAAPVGSKWDEVDAYLRAHNHALGGYYFTDAYAGTPYLRHALSHGLIRHGWRPNAGSWSNDTLPYQPPNSGKGSLNHALSATPAALWQTGNYWYSKNADENLVLRANVGSHLQAAGNHRPAPPAPHPAGSHFLHRAWPHYMHSGDYFGLITGPAASHGGFHAAERPDVQAIQHRLQALKFAPNTEGWADGKFEAPTHDAVAAWQRKLYAKTTSRYGEVWHDDWVHLFTF